MATVKVNDENFDKEVLKSSKPIVVDFWAEWCGPCKALTPMLEKVAAEYADKGVALVKVDVDQDKFIAAQFQVQSIPTVYAFFKGQPVDGFQGALPQSEIKAFVDRVVKAGGGEAPGDTLADAVAAAVERLLKQHPEWVHEKDRVRSARVG